MSLKNAPSWMTMGTLTFLQFLNLPALGLQGTREVPGLLAPTIVRRGDNSIHTHVHIGKNIIGVRKEHRLTEQVISQVGDRAAKLSVIQIRQLPSDQSNHSPSKRGRLPYH